jgi:hypothetical protein
VARLARPGCPHMKKLIAGEDEGHPDKWLRQVAAHVDVCRTCSLWREDQPNAIELIGEVPAEPAPPEVRDEVLDRVDLLWSVLGPPEWTAAVLGQNPPAIAPVATSDLTPPPTGDPTPPPTAAPDTGEPTEIAAPEETAPPAEGEVEPTARDYDAYDEVESLVPPPPRLRRNGFPRSMYPQRRRLVRAAVIVIAALFVGAVFANFRGFGRDTRSFAAEAKAGVARTQPPPTTAPPTTAPPVTTGAPGPDTRPPFVYNLATVFGCIGPKQPTTSALASVVDPGDHLASVELVFVDASGAETRKRMTAAGGAFEAPIGPYTADTTITWRVVASDEAGNSSSSDGPSVAASSSC